MQDLVTWLGAIASGLFVIATAAQSLKAYKNGHSDGVSELLLWQLQIGFVFASVYVLFTIGWDWVLMSSYILQAAFWGVVIKFKYWRRK